jgi:hypothetical protein
MSDRAGMDKPAPPPEAVLIRIAREAARIKTPASSRAVGISTARWSQIEQGYETKPGGVYKPVRAPDGTLAHMASAVGVSPERLEQAGRPDAADILREILRQDDPAPGPGPSARQDDLTPEEKIEIADSFLDLLRTRQAERRESGNGNGNGNGA